MAALVKEVRLMLPPDLHASVRERMEREDTGWNELAEQLLRRWLREGGAPSRESNTKTGGSK